jgi:SAM-dependent methyltransferase
MTTDVMSLPALDLSAIDPAKLEAAVGKVFGELGVFLSAPVLVLGDRLELFRALAAGGPATSTELADRTGLVERYVREWLRAATVGGYLTYDPATQRFTLPPEMAAVLAYDDAPTALIGVVPSLRDLMNHLPAIERFFRTGGGQGWADYGPELARAQARFTRPMFINGLIQTWLPAVDGLVARLDDGARIIDIGCGHGVSTILAAQAWPASTFVGIDPDANAIAEATIAAEAAGVADRVTFHTERADGYPDRGFDLVMFLDCLHDMGDPVAAVAHARDSLTDDGVVFVAEPLAADRFEDDLDNPYARIGYAISTLVCTPSSLSQPGTLGLGAMAGPARIQQVLSEAGLAVIRRLPAEIAPFNLLFEARR